MKELKSITSAILKAHAVAMQIRLSFAPKRAQKKYGERGLLYGMSDSGHVMANLTLAAKELGLGSEYNMHTTNWGEKTKLADKIPVFDMNFFAAPSLESDHSEPTHILSAMTWRKSSNAFDGVPCSLSKLSRTLSMADELSNPMLGSSHTLEHHLIRRRNETEWLHYKSTDLSQLCEGSACTTSVSPKDLFCGQEFASEASVLFFVTCDKTQPSETLVQNLIGGYLGQCLYLSTECHGIGACCVGGFEYDKVAATLNLKAEKYAAYAMLFGQNGATREKVDRRQTATPRAPIVAFPSFPNASKSQKV